MASDNEVRLQLKGGRTIKIVRTETPTGGMWSIPEMPEIAAHQNISVIRDRLRGKGLIASRPGAKARFKVEDRFYFGKGRKERFAENNEGWALQSVNVPDWGTHHFPSEAAARKYATDKGYNFDLRLLYNGKTVAIKRWDNSWTK